MGADVNKKDSEVTRIVEIGEQVFHIHIHLTEEEIRSLLLPHVISVFAQELGQQTLSAHSVTTDRTEVSRWS